MRLSASLLPAATLALLASTSGYATEYLTSEQARAALFPGATFTATSLTLSPEQIKDVSQRSRVRLRNSRIQVWQASSGGWFFVDEVLGKHELITYAVGLDDDGTVRGVEILTYRESYGHEIRNPAWRAKFIGKTAASPLILDQDIPNLTGATLSSRHVMEGVKRILAIHALALAHQTG